MSRQPGAVLHASAVVWLGRGVLLRGRSNSGKSDLALRLIEAGAVLIADDAVRVERDGPTLVARAVNLPGLIELRGQGIFRLPAAERAALHAVVDLVPADELERLPEPATVALEGVELPLHRLDARAASAVARLRVVLSAERVA